MWKKKAGEAVEARYGHIEEARIRQARTVSAMIGVDDEGYCRRNKPATRDEGIKTLEDVYECEEKALFPFNECGKQGFKRFFDDSAIFTQK